MGKQFMESIKYIFKIGNGPSSSHTMGPRKAAANFRESTIGASRYEVTLYGALAATGRDCVATGCIFAISSERYEI